VVDHHLFRSVLSFGGSVMSEIEASEEIVKASGEGTGDENH
jgi:hypothetical protein